MAGLSNTWTCVSFAFILNFCVTYNHAHCEDRYQIHISMPAGVPKQVSEKKNQTSKIFASAEFLQHDDYLCTSMKVDKVGYIRKFVPTASGDRAHHLLLFGCFGPANSTSGTWKCLAEDICADGTYARLLYSWTKNAAEFDLPKDVGIPIGSSLGGPDYLVLQIHYAHVLLGNVIDYSGVTLVLQKEKPKNFARIYVLIGYGDSIPPGIENYHMNMSCKFKSSTNVFAFAYRVHAHLLGRVVSGYVESGNSWTLLGKTNPLWPQWYYPVPNEPVTIHPGDTIAGQCIFDTTNQTKPTRFGPTEADEMCNFYFYYYGEADEITKITNDGCPNRRVSQVFNNYPSEGDTRFPFNKELEKLAAGRKDSFGISETADWPSNKLELGEIGGLSVDPVSDKFIIFHRGSRSLTSESFNSDNTLIPKTTIEEDTIIAISLNSTILESFGASMFYMPGDIFMDTKGNIWLTDMGAHTVLKFSPSSKIKPELTIGVPMIPGNDNKHFCRPSSVVTTLDGSVFVADGICNNRVVQLSANGRFIHSFGTKVSKTFNANPPLGAFGMINSISADDDRPFLYISDADYGRVQIYNWTSASFVGEINDKRLDGGLSAIKYCHSADTLFAANSEKDDSDLREIRIFAIDTDSRGLLYSFGPTRNPLRKLSALGFSHDCLHVIVGESTKINSLRRLDISFTNRETPQEVAHLLAEAESYTSSASRQKSSKSTAKVIVAVVFGVGAIVGFAGFVMYLYKKSKPRDARNYITMS